MRGTPTETANAIRALNARVQDGCATQATIEMLSERLKILKAAIESGLLELERTEFTADDGGQAVRIDTESRSWAVDLLEKVLPKQWFERLCPRKPEVAKLSTLLELMELPPEVRSKKIEKSKGKIELPGIGAAELRKCSSVKSGSRIELRAPATVASAQPKREIAA